jgi:hypothetical protein
MDQASAWTKRPALHPAFFVFLTFLVGTMLGCSEGVDRVKVTGQVLIDGKPVPAVFIRVYPKGARDSSSDLDAEGRFDLRSYNPGDGVPLGTHKVTINGREILQNRQQKWHAPPKYTRVGSSGLTLEVTGSTDDAVIELTWGKGKPFIKKSGRSSE